MPIQSLFILLSIFFGAKLSPIRPEWRSLRDNSSPSAQLLTPFYSNCLSVLTSLRKILSAKTGAILFLLQEMLLHST